MQFPNRFPTRLSAAKWLFTSILLMTFWLVMFSIKREQRKEKRADRVKQEVVRPPLRAPDSASRLVEMVVGIGPYLGKATDLCAYKSLWTDDIQALRKKLGVAERVWGCQAKDGSSLSLDNRVVGVLVRPMLLTCDVSTSAGIKKVYVGVAMIKGVWKVVKIRHSI